MNKFLQQETLRSVDADSCKHDDGPDSKNGLSGITTAKWFIQEKLKREKR